MHELLTPSVLRPVLDRLGVPEDPSGIAVDGDWEVGGGAEIRKTSPIDGELLVAFRGATPHDAEHAVAVAHDAFHAWRAVPAPVRGQMVRRFGELVRENKEDLASLISWEAGKITPEALGEVQEVIDVCEYAVGLSRQLCGLSIASERPHHRLTEQWHPLGPVGVITAFNFPMAVWAWNAAIAWVCGDPVVWKPSEKTPLCAMACQTLAMRVADEVEPVPAGISTLVIGDAAVGKTLAQDHRLPLVSATGSVPMGRDVARRVADRLGRSLLELGGNNGAIVTPHADMDLTLRGLVFAALGTSGQRCTTLRRVIVHRSIADVLRLRLQQAFASVTIGDPTEPSVLMGPLIDESAYLAMEAALDQAEASGGEVLGGGRVLAGVPAGGVYVKPALVEITHDAPIVQQETFAPILYLHRYDTLEEAVRIHNNVPQGLASSIFTNDIREAEYFCSAEGSDCGIVNVNAGPSGAEIGGAFGGEKDTGGGRESGSDAWKAYMRRATNTVNYSEDLPLAQGVSFDV